MAENKLVYVFNGFLDAGKSTCIRNTLYDPHFNEGERTLIIAFEQGDVDFDEKFLNYTHSQLLYLDSLKQLDQKKMRELNKQYRFDRVFLELNGMEDDSEFFKNGFIDSWELVQVLTLIDASTFRLYSANMKQFMYNHIAISDFCVVNRTEGEDLRYLRNNIKAINISVGIAFEDENGNVINSLEDELFDVSKEVEVADSDYGLWYMDALDNPLKYDNKTVSLNMKKLEDLPEYETALIMGRQAMVCCAEDISNISLTVVGVRKKELKENQYYRVKGTIRCMDDEEGYKTCVLYANEVREAAAPSDELVYFN